MDIAQVVELALANVNDRHRVEIAALEPADIAMEAAGGLTQLITELVDNALEFSEPNEEVSVTGVFAEPDYLVSISDDGIGIPEHMLDALNDVLSEPLSQQPGADAPLGMVFVARLAARNEISVRLIPAVPGTTARVTIPGRLVSSRDASDDSWSQTPEIVYQELASTSSRHVIAMSESARGEAEAFLEGVFRSLQGGSRRPSGDETDRVGNGQGAPRGTRPPAGGPELRRRVPGQNFSVAEDDPSIISGEGAVDIRINLNRYDEGRRAAEDDPGTDAGKAPN